MKTNLEKLREMSAEAFADLMNMDCECMACMALGKCKSDGTTEGCRNNFVDWLNSPLEVNEYE